ncbi:MAG: thiol-disulfide oxidoreductase DCC family protein [Chitinophagales bacterium]
MENKQHIIFFDGVCNLCNRSVQTIIKKDEKEIFHFAALQSDFTKAFFLQKNFKPSVSSVVYWDGERFYLQSTAALKISGKLKFPAPLLQFLGIFPKFLRDVVYNFIAKNRYKWFGRRESCMVPTEELKARFLS